MQITEPVTMLTDYLLTAVSVVFAVLIARIIGPRNRVCAWFWCAAFVASGVAAASGGTYHGFANYIDTGTRQSLWNIVMYSMGAGAAFITAGIHSAYIRWKDGTVQWLITGILITLAGLAVQRSGFPPNENFNHNDLYHLIQTVGLYPLYKCGLTLRDRPGIPI